MMGRSMDAAEVEENLFAAGDAKLHGEMCKRISVVLSKILAIFPVLEAARPRSKSGIQALCSLHVALDKAKNLLQHCSNYSKLYLAITGESILAKFEKTRSALQELLRHVEDIVPQSIGSQSAFREKAKQYHPDQNQKNKVHRVSRYSLKGPRSGRRGNVKRDLSLF